MKVTYYAAYAQTVSSACRTRRSFCRVARATEARRQHELLTKVTRRIRNLRLSSAFNAWADSIIALKAGYSRAAAVVTRMNTSARSKAFNTWRHVVVHVKERRSLVSRAVRLMQNRQMAAAFSSWRGAVFAAKRGRHIAAKMLSRLTRRGLLQVTFVAIAMPI
jgi:hypothetical protein